MAELSIDARRELITAMAAKGASWADIQAAAGCSRSTVARTLREAREKSTKLGRQRERVGELAGLDRDVPTAETITPPSFGHGADITDDVLKAFVRRSLVDRVRRLEDLQRLLDDRLYHMVAENRQSNWVRDYTWASSVVQDKLAAAVAAALQVGPSVAPHPVRAGFEYEIIDTPAPEGAPEDGSAP